VDAARLAELAALGYVDEAAAPVAGGTGVDKATEAFNRARLARDRGDLEDADAAYREAIERDPRFFFAMLELSMLARRAGDDEQALYWMVRAMQTDDPRLPDRLPVGFVQLARAAGRLEPALQVLDAMPPRWRQRAAYHAALGVAAAARDELDEARAAFERALAIDPADLDALEGLLRLVAEDGSTSWRPRVETAFRSVRTDLIRLRRLGALCLKYGQYTAAGQCFEEVLDSDPTDAATLRDLARVRQVQGDLEAAVATMARSLELEPADPDAWRLHARLLTDAGRPTEAAAAEARALTLEEATR
jgi:tetratricopeptide (TPR) repeat protein